MGLPLGTRHEGKKLVPDETGSREWRQRKGCLGQGNERTDLSLDTQAEFTPCVIKEECLFLFLPIFLY